MKNASSIDDNKSLVSSLSEGSLQFIEPARCPCKSNKTPIKPSRISTWMPPCPNALKTKFNASLMPIAACLPGYPKSIAYTVDRTQGSGNPDLHARDFQTLQPTLHQCMHAKRKDQFIHPGQSQNSRHHSSHEKGIVIFIAHVLQSLHFFFDVGLCLLLLYQ